MTQTPHAAPAFRAPPGACDAHFHVFGRPEDYPYGDPKLRYKPPVATLDDFLAHAAGFGFERFVFVQPSAYGRDNRCMLDAMREMRRRLGDAYPRHVRGVVDLDDDVSDEMLQDLHDLGVRGMRINVSPVAPHDAALPGAMIPRIRRFEARFANIGWMLDFLGPGWLTDALIPTLRTLRVPYSLAHMGMFLAKDGPAQPGFRRLLALLAEGERRCWVKLTGVYRMATAPDFADAIPMAHALIAAAPDRLIWGSDYPHLSFADKVDPNALTNLLVPYAPDPATRQRILVDNPAALFGF